MLAQVGLIEVSYPKDIEDYSLEELEEEIERRVSLQHKDLCDYCERPAGSLPACKHPDRHGTRVVKDLSVEEAVDMIARGSSIMTQGVRESLSDKEPGVVGTNVLLDREGNDLYRHTVFKTVVTPAVLPEDES